MERCKYELFVENYFGFNTDEVITEKTKITTDFGQLVNLLAMFDNERASAETSHEHSGLNKPDVKASALEKLKIAKKELNDIYNFDRDMEFEYGDPGERAMRAIEAIDRIDGF